MIKKYIGSFDNIEVSELHIELVEYYVHEEKLVRHDYIDILLNLNSNINIMVTANMKVEEYNTNVFDVEYEILYVSLYDSNKEFVCNLYDVSIKDELEYRNVGEYYNYL